jgi:hypothetical protein
MSVLAAARQKLSGEGGGIAGNPQKAVVDSSLGTIRMLD